MEENAEEFEQLLVIDKNDLDNVCAQQADIYYRIADRYSLARDEADLAKAELDIGNSKLALSFRQKAEKDGIKTTEGKISEAVLASSEHAAGQELLQQKQLEVARWGNLREAFTQRSQMIKILADLYSAGYWTSGSLRGAAGSASNKDASIGREALRAARKPLRTR